MPCTSNRDVYFSNRFEEIFTPAIKTYAPLQSKIFSHLDQFLTGFSALQVAAGGSVGRQGLDLGKYGNNLTSW